MVEPGKRGRAWRVGEYLGLVSDKPNPKFGSRAWWLNMVPSVVSAVVGVGLLEHFHWL